jgi:hypothetical protein
LFESLIDRKTAVNGVADYGHADKGKRIRISQNILFGEDNGAA